MKVLFCQPITRYLERIKANIADKNIWLGEADLEQVKVVLGFTSDNTCLRRGLLNSIHFMANGVKNFRVMFSPWLLVWCFLFVLLMLPNKIWSRKQRGCQVRVQPLGNFHKTWAQQGNTWIFQASKAVTSPHVYIFRKMKQDPGSLS